jgi:hypothetical protein
MLLWFKDFHVLFVLFVVKFRGFFPPTDTGFTDRPMCKLFIMSNFRFDHAAAAALGKICVFGACFRPGLAYFSGLREFFKNLLQ